MYLSKFIHLSNWFVYEFMGLHHAPVFSLNVETQYKPPPTLVSLQHNDTGASVSLNSEYGQGLLIHLHFAVTVNVYSRHHPLPSIIC